MFQEKSYVWGGNISKQIIRYVTGSVGKCRNELYVIAKFHIIVHEIAKTVYGNLKSAILEKGKIITGKDERQRHILLNLSQ